MAEPLVTAELILKKMTDLGLAHLPSGTLRVWFVMVWCGSPPQLGSRGSGHSVRRWAGGWRGQKCIGIEEFLGAVNNVFQPSLNFSWHAFQMPANTVEYKSL